MPERPEKFGKLGGSSGRKSGMLPDILSIQ